MQKRNLYIIIHSARQKGKGTTFNTKIIYRLYMYWSTSGYTKMIAILSYFLDLLDFVATKS